VGPGLIASPLYDAQDRLLSYGNCTYGYKADGSLQTKTCPDGTTTYDYDAFGNLRGVTLPNGTAITYIIDGQNRRVGKKVNGTLVESFLYDDQLKRVGWYDGTGAIKAQFVFGLEEDAPALMVKGGQTYRLVHDQLGSIREVVASDGSVAERLDYDEFGNILEDSSPNFQPFAFASGVRDVDTGLTRFGARDYDSVTGRWTATDPLRFGGGDSNLAVYVGNDPVNRIDPTGEATIQLPRSPRPPEWCALNPGACPGTTPDGKNWLDPGPPGPEMPICPEPQASPWLNKCLNACSLGTEHMQQQFCSKLYNKPKIYALCMAAAAAGEVACKGFCFARWGRR
jgi:RHS repeat-associated protein